MSLDLVETLPLPQRLALSYAPRKARAATLALLALDTRLAGIIRTGGEPVIAQMKLAWWRERLGQAPADWPVGEPLLALLRECGIDATRLVPLVDGWEMLLADDLGRSELTAFARGRALGWAAVSDGTGQSAPLAPVEKAGREWALLDLARHLDSEEEATRALEAAAITGRAGARLPREVRSLAVLHSLSLRAYRRGSSELLDGPGAMAAALRSGLLGM